MLYAWRCNVSSILKKKPLQYLYGAGLLANMAAMYTRSITGQKDLKPLRKRIAVYAQTVAEEIEARGFELVSVNF